MDSRSTRAAADGITCCSGLNAKRPRRRNRGRYAATGCTGPSESSIAHRRRTEKRSDDMRPDHWNLSSNVDLLQLDEDQARECGDYERAARRAWVRNRIVDYCLGTT